jgi:hypothetical protein
MFHNSPTGTTVAGDAVSPLTLDNKMFFLGQAPALSSKVSPIVPAAANEFLYKIKLKNWR